jgi:hypothetical protein
MRYFWIITLQWHGPGGLTVNTVSGSANPEGLASREVIFKGVLAEARRMMGIPAAEPAATLFYSLEVEDI